MAGTFYDSGPMEAQWNSNNPPMDEALRTKFRWVAGEVLTAEHVNALEETIWACSELNDVGVLAELLSELK